MPVGAANLFSATDPKLAIYDYASSFFGGVAPLVRTCTAVHAPNDAALSCISYTLRQCQQRMLETRQCHKSMNML